MGEKSRVTCHLTGALPAPPVPFALSLLCASLLACSADRHPPAGRETHWLRTCEDDAACGKGACECGVCVLPCEDGICSEGLICLDGESDAVEAICGQEAQPAGLCAVECSEDADCADELSCQDGACRPSDISTLGTGRPTDAAGAGDAGAFQDAAAPAHADPNADPLAMVVPDAGDGSNDAFVDVPDSDTLDSTLEAPSGGLPVTGLCDALAAGAPPVGVQVLVDTPRLGLLRTAGSGLFWTVEGPGPGAELWRSELDGTSAQRLAANLGGAQELVVDGGAVITGESDGNLLEVLSRPITGGASVRLGSQPGLNVHGLTADATHVFWGGNDGVYRSPRVSGISTVLAARNVSGGWRGATVTLLGDSLYFTEGTRDPLPGAPNLMRVPKDASSAAMPSLTGQAGIMGMLALDGELYLAVFGTRDVNDNHQLDGQIIKLTGDSTTELVTDTGMPPIELAGNDTHLYWLDGRAFNGQGSTLWRVARSGGEPERLVDGMPSAHDLNVYDNHVYWMAACSDQTRLVRIDASL